MGCQAFAGGVRFALHASLRHRLPAILMRRCRLQGWRCVHIVLIRVEFQVQQSWSCCMRPALASVALLGIGVCASITAVADARPDTPASYGKWTVAWHATWTDARLLREGYVLLVNQGQRIYCRLDQTPRLGSRLNSPVFCADADTLQMLYNARGHSGAHGVY